MTADPDTAIQIRIAIARDADLDARPAARNRGVGQDLMHAAAALAIPDQLAITRGTISARSTRFPSCASSPHMTPPRRSTDELPNNLLSRSRRPRRLRCA